MSSKNKIVNNEVNNLVHFDNLLVDVQNEMGIILTKSRKCSSFLKGYHTHTQNMWDPVKVSLTFTKSKRRDYTSQNGTNEFSV